MAKQRSFLESSNNSELLHFEHLVTKHPLPLEMKVQLNPTEVK